MNVQDFEIKAATDPEFRRRVLAEPRAVLAEQGMTLPENIEVSVLESTPERFVICIPPALPDDAELSEDAMAAVSGGTTPAFPAAVVWGMGLATGVGVGGGFALGMFT